MKELELTQIEQLKTIGEYLYQARQARSISLDEIAVKTYIPLRLLQALESGQFEQLPEPVFVQGFIRRYADVLGLDGMSLSKSFSVGGMPVISGAAKTKAVPSGSVGSGLEPESLPAEKVWMPPVETVASVEDIAPPRSQTTALPILPLIAGCVLLVGVGVAAVMFNRTQLTSDRPSEAIATNEANRTTVAQPTPSSQPSSPQASPSPSSPSLQVSASPTPTATQASAGTDSTLPIEVAVNLTGDSWLEVVIDGKTEFEGILKKGDQKTWTAQKALTLRSGNAGAVTVSYNQGEAKPMGALGDVKDAVFPPKQAQTVQGN